MSPLETVPDPTVALLRHTVATLAYRAGKALRDAPPEFAGFEGAARTPIRILAHMGDLFDWALGLADGRHEWHNSTPLPWDQEVARFFAALEAFDRRLATDEELGQPAKRLFQGPIADALTHTGQLAMLRRMAGCAIKGENYFTAEVTVGVVGIGQPAPKVEF
jgi:hypothetical protein